MFRSYRAVGHDWTPLSRNPCWLSNAFHCLRDYVKRNRPSLISSAGTFDKEISSNHKLNCAGDKSIADDFGASRYCKCESSLCATIHWGFSCVPTICSSLKINYMFALATIAGSDIQRDTVIFNRWNMTPCALREMFSLAASWQAIVNRKCGLGVHYTVMLRCHLSSSRLWPD